MKKFIKRSFAVLLAMLMISSVFTCFAADSVYEKEYEHYSSYVLLGDSVASGWSDVVEKETRFVRVEGSYGAFVADDLGVDVYHPMACIGFRTTDLRYIFEDDYEADQFLFYSIDAEEMAWRIPLIRQAVADADLITLNVGGNDWGSYVGWHIYYAIDQFQLEHPEFVAQVKSYLEEAGTDPEIIASIIDIAALCGTLPELLEILPQALMRGFENFFYNWNYVVEDIYALNPDVTLIVIGMFDNMVQDQETADANEAALVKLSVSQMIIDYANTPMRDGAAKYGYTFIDPVGTVCEQNHPSIEGHRFIADRILEALPDAKFPYTDVARNAAEYKAIEYLYQNGIMNGISETEFGYALNLTKGQLAETIYNACGADIVSVSDAAADATLVETAIAGFNMVKNTGNFLGTIKGLIATLKLVFGNGMSNMTRTLTRAEAAVIIRDYIDMI
ncbi:MAG: S-layer homology domain-containing protein [Clostridia bacterium]|nr:S-layer homology domain-containing protein [Clostridia bacterium]